MFGAALVGMALQAVLPDEHLSSDSKDVVKLAMGLIATMAALVLGLLTGSAKSTFDAQDAEVKETAAQIMVLDRALAGYGPETRSLREEIRRALVARLALTWPTAGSAPPQLETADAKPPVELVDEGLRVLAPRDDGQRLLQSRALQATADLMHARWLVPGEAGTPVQTPLLVILVFWFAALFVSFGLFAPRNGTVVVVLLAASMSVAASVFLILETNQPFAGIVQHLRCAAPLHARASRAVESSGGSLGLRRPPVAATRASSGATPSAAPAGTVTMASTLECWFEPASTYSYPAVMRVAQACAARGVPLAWRPFLLGPIFAAQGWTDSPFNLYPVKGRYMWRDLERICAALGLPFRRPSRFPRPSLVGARVACLAQDAPWVGDFVRALYRANLADDRETGDAAVVAALLDAVGQDGAAWVARAGEDAAKATLRAQTERAQALGIFGAPTFVVDGELFWGNDRLDDAVAWAVGARPPV